MVLVERLARCGMSQTQIAMALDVAKHTIDHLAQQIEQWQVLTKSTIRSKLIEKALAGEGDTQALIFLHKAWLGMRDNQPVVQANINIQTGEAIDSSPEIQALKMEITSQFERLTEIEVERRVIEMQRTDEPQNKTGLLGVVTYEQADPTPSK